MPDLGPRIYDDGAYKSAEYADPYEVDRVH